MTDFAAEAAVIHKYVETLIWPALLLVGLLLFRHAIAQMIDRVKTAKLPGGWELEIGKKIETLQQKVEEHDAHTQDYEEQKLHDHNALSLVDMQLSETVSDALSVAVSTNQNDVVAAIKEASPLAQKEIFKLAQDVRKAAWRQMYRLHRKDYADERQRETDLNSAEKWMRRTVPIFRALTQTEHGANWHRYHAQLGYALKDTGQTREAKVALERAIELWERDTNGAPVSPHYAFNWAICSIMLDNDVRGLDEPTEARRRSRIVAALRQGLRFNPLETALLSSGDVRSWLARNHLSFEDLDDEPRSVAAQ